MQVGSFIPPFKLPSLACWGSFLCAEQMFGGAPQEIAQPFGPHLQRREEGAFPRVGCSARSLLQVRNERLDARAVQCLIQRHHAVMQVRNESNGSIEPRFFSCFFVHWNSLHAAGTSFFRERTI